MSDHPYVCLRVMAVGLLTLMILPAAAAVLTPEPRGVLCDGFLSGKFPKVLTPWGDYSSGLEYSSGPKYSSGLTWNNKLGQVTESIITDLAKFRKVSAIGDDYPPDLEYSPGPGYSSDPVVECEISNGIKIV